MTELNDSERKIKLEHKITPVNKKFSFKNTKVQKLSNIGEIFPL